MGELKHYGMPRRSGRYPWGSGGNPQRSPGFRSQVNELRKSMSDVEIADFLGLSSTTELRTKLSLEKASERASQMAAVNRLADKGYSNMEIGRRMGINESSVRSLRDPVLAERSIITSNTAKILKDGVDSSRFIDVGTGVEVYLGVSRVRLNTAVASLVEQGYKVHSVNVNQVGVPGQFTRVKVLGAPDTTWKELVKDPSKIQPIRAYSEDYGRTFKSDLGIDTPQPVSSRRVTVRYAEDGGALKDGVIELRRGAKDLDLGSSRYAQVRIAIDDTHYAKGMAMYSDDVPLGKDILYNTNKKRDVPMLGSKDNSVFKLLKDDPDNPFGSSIKRQHGALNVVNEEGDWETWSRTLSSQFLSKQPISLAKKQLGLALKEKQKEYEEISKLTNPVVKRKLLNEFSEECDSAAVHLKAAALPRQASKVILPLPGIKEHEIYAPSFRPGETVVLVRHPHAGTFELPQLTVNNNSRIAKSIMGNALDAVGIHPNVAKKLSGADFDGDSVIVIPNNRGLVKTSAPLKGLENFDPIESYRIPAGSKIAPMTAPIKARKMGEVSNLITDMTIKGASTGELVRAVRHSMVVIDAEKHNLDYRQSAIDHGIPSLSAKYQKGPLGGVSTLVSRAKSDIRVPERKPRRAIEGGPIDAKTGEKVFVPTGKTYTVVKYRDPADGKLKETSPSNAERKGYEVLSTKEKFRTKSSTKMAETPDARTLSSGRPIEEVYALHANQLKALGNTARKEMIVTELPRRSPSAAVTYAKEVASLQAKLNVAIKNSPIERQAQILANTIIKRKEAAHPQMDRDDLKKISNQALAEARARTGAKKVRIGSKTQPLTDKEWEAIQAGALSSSKLSRILDNADMDTIKKLATPRSKTVLQPTKLNRATLMLNNNASLADVADALGVSVKVLTEALNTERSKV